jgi:hypothetical protein
MIYSLSLLVLLTAFTFNVSCFTLCPRKGLIPLSYRYRHRHLHFLHFSFPKFRKLRIINHSVFENGLHDAENVFHLLKSLPRDCFTYEDDHYTYEYCHMESARQMGKKVQNHFREEYNLGSYCNHRSIKKYSPLLRLAKVNLVDGDLCDGNGNGLHRKTKIKFFCSDPKLAMHIVSAREKSKCNYRILVHVPELCFK